MPNRLADVYPPFPALPIFPTYCRSAATACAIPDKKQAALPEVAMLQLELDEQGQEMLTEVLKSFLAELRNEVSHTDRRAYRDRLKAQAHLIEAILGKLERS